jgi:hypothetical protein
VSMALAGLSALKGFATNLEEKKSQM